MWIGRMGHRPWRRRCSRGRRGPVVRRVPSSISTQPPALRWTSLMPALVRAEPPGPLLIAHRQTPSGSNPPASVTGPLSPRGCCGVLPLPGLAGTPYGYMVLIVAADRRVDEEWVDGRE